MRRALVVLFVAALVSVGLAPGAGAAAKLPVPYDFLSSAVLAGATQEKNPPGANDWHCTPTRQHPEPVVLVHGLLGNQATNWQTYAPLLKNNGYCVYALTYGQSPAAPAPFQNTFGGFTEMEQSAKQLKTFVAKVRRSTGADKVDILGHSEGTVMPDYYAKFLGGAKYIDRYVSLAPIWHGTNLGGMASLDKLAAAFGFQGTDDQLFGDYFASGPELTTGSAFYKKLRSGGTPAVAGISYTNIVTKYDELVSPYTSGIQSGMTNYTVQDFCDQDYSEHFEIAADPVAAQLVLNALDPAHPHKVPCRLVLPFEGG
jgi:triacylglycerol esterase/lipase EstA (alpha/beta hydrolase family)